MAEENSTVGAIANFLSSLRSFPLWALAGLSAAQGGLELTDVSLRKPNLESVFLHLTGRELRD